MNGTLLRFYVHENRKHRHRLLYEWLLESRASKAKPRMRQRRPLVARAADSAAPLLAEGGLA